jgi:L-alanine-DL-glutamate epimerase-like enolase superfamily enzyme
LLAVILPYFLLIQPTQARIEAANQKYQAAYDDSTPTARAAAQKQLDDAKASAQKIRDQWHVKETTLMPPIDGVNIKLMKSGITGALQIIDLCRVAGKKLMIGCMLETELGIAAATQIAAGTGAFDHVDLDSHHLLAPVPQVSGGLKHCGENLTIAHKSGTYGWGVTVEKHVHSV